MLIYIHVHIYIYIHMYMYTHTCLCVYTFTYTWIYLHIIHPYSHFLKSTHTKISLESSGCRTRPLETSGYRPRLTHCGANPNRHLVRSRWYRVAKTHRMPYVCRSFSAKVPYNQWLFCEKWSATWGIIRVFATLYKST